MGYTNETKTIEYINFDKRVRRRCSREKIRDAIKDGRRVCNTAPTFDKSNVFMSTQEKICEDRLIYLEQVILTSDETAEKFVAMEAARLACNYLSELQSVTTLSPLQICNKTLDELKSVLISGAPIRQVQDAMER